MRDTRWAGKRLTWALAALVSLGATACGGSDTSCGAGTVLMNGVCVASLPAADGGVTCGAGTVLQAGMCVAAAADAGPTADAMGLSCGTGTVEDGGVCVPSVAPSGPVFDTLAVGHLDVTYDTRQSLYVGHRLPMRIGITSRAATPLRTPAQVPVVVSLLEHAAGTPTAAQAAALRQCFLGSFMAPLDGGADEINVEANLIIPPECLPAGQTSVTYNLVVQIDKENLFAREAAEHVYIFSEANRMAAPTQTCKSTFNASAMADGCVYQLRVEPTPGIDIRPAIEPTSRVAIFWPEDARATDALRRHEISSLLIDQRAFGRDPFTVTGAAVAMLPGVVTTRVRIAPAVGPRAGEYLPLNVQAATMGASPVAERSTSSLAPASDNRAVYDLFATPEVLTAVTTGDWRNVDEFTIEACMLASFSEAGALGDDLREDEEGRGPRTASTDNCKRYTVLGVRAVPPATTASRLDLNREWTRRWGGDRVALEATLNTENSTSVGVATSDTRANLRLTSQYLPDITVAQARAYANVDLFSPDASAMEFTVDVFGSRLTNYSRRIPESRELYMRDWNIMRRQCRDKTVMITIFPVNVEGCVQGTVGLAVNATVARDEMVMPMRAFPMADTEGQLQITARPYASAGASASVSLNVIIARAGVEGMITLVDVSSPVVGSASLGLTRMDEMTMNPSSRANLNVNWTLEVRGISGALSLFVDTRGVDWCGRWVRYPCGVNWSRRGEFNLFSFGSDPERFTLLDRTFGDAPLAQ